MSKKILLPRMFVAVGAFRVDGDNGPAVHSVRIVIDKGQVQRVEEIHPPDVLEIAVGKAEAALVDGLSRERPA